MEPIKNTQVHFNPPLQIAKAPYQCFTITQEGNVTVNQDYVIQISSTTKKTSFLFFEKIMEALETQKFLKFKDHKGNISPLFKKHQVRFYMEHMFHFVCERFANEFANMKKMKKENITIEQNSDDLDRTRFVLSYLRAQAHLCIFDYPAFSQKFSYDEVKRRFQANRSQRLIPFLTSLIWKRCVGKSPPQSLQEENIYQFVLQYLQDLKTTFNKYLAHLSLPAYRAASEFTKDLDIMIPILLNPLPFVNRQHFSFVDEQESDEDTASFETASFSDSSLYGGEILKEERKDFLFFEESSEHLPSNQEQKDGKQVFEEIVISPSVEQEKKTSTKEDMKMLMSKEEMFPIKYILDLVTHPAFKEFLTTNELKRFLTNGILKEGDYFFSLSHLSYPHLAFQAVMKDTPTSSLEIKYFKVERNQKGNFVMPIQKNSNPNIPQRAIETTSLEGLIQVLKKRDFFRGKLKQPASFKDRYTELRSYYRLS